MQSVSESDTLKSNRTKEEFHEEERKKITWDDRQRIEQLIKVDMSVAMIDFYYKLC